MAYFVFFRQCQLGKSESMFFGYKNWIITKTVLALWACQKFLP